MRRVAPASPLTGVSEREWQTQVVGLAKLMGWKRIYHTYNSQRSHSGFPDLVMARERLIFVELKSMAGKLSASQQEWLDARSPRLEAERPRTSRRDTETPREHLPVPPATNVRDRPLTRNAPTPRRRDPVIHIHAPAMHAVKTEPGPSRWCFGCRKRVAGTWTMWAADDWENDYYGPHWAFTCDGCGQDRRLGFGLVPE